MRCQNPRAARRAAWSLIAILSAGAGGCGNTATVAGKVTYQGRPVIHGSVIFLGADKTARSAAIQPDGSYTVEGVPAGKVTIGVISRAPSKGRSVLRGGKAELSNKTAAGSQPRAAGQSLPSGGAGSWFPLPEKFEDPGGSGLGCVLPSGRVIHDVELN